MSEDYLEDREDGVLLSVKVNPGSSEFEVKGINEWRGNVRISVPAPARDGRANEELLNGLESVLGCEAEIVSGRRSREKKILIVGSSISEISDKLGL